MWHSCETNLIKISSLTGQHAWLREEWAGAFFVFWIHVDFVNLVNVVGVIVFRARRFDYVDLVASIYRVDGRLEIRCDLITLIRLIRPSFAKRIIRAYHRKIQKCSNPKEKVKEQVPRPRSNGIDQWSHIRMQETWDEMS